MAFPGHPLATNKTGATAQANDHAPHHNAIATAVNALQVQIATPYTSSQITDGTITGTDTSWDALRAAKIATEAKSPVRSTATGGAFSGITASTTICTLNLAGQTRAGDWLILAHVLMTINSPTTANLFAMHVKDGGTVIGDYPWDCLSGGRKTMGGMIWLPVAASTAKTITMLIVRFGGAASTVDCYAAATINRIEAKFWPT